MSDSKKNPPPDDFSKTTPNVKLPNSDEPTDWEKTNYGFSPQPPSEDWGKTVANYNIPSRKDEEEEPDFSKTYLPSNQPKNPDDWAMTQANINVPADFGNKPEDYKEQGSRENSGNYEFTTPLIRLPEAERAKYQNLPPTEESARQKEEEKKIAGIPAWVWITTLLGTMFFFSVLIIGIVLYFVIIPSDFTVVIEKAPLRSDVKVGGADWGVDSTESESKEGTIRLLGLKPEPKRIEIIHPQYICQPIAVDGTDLAGQTRRVTAECEAKKIAPGEDCSDIGMGEEDKAERCARAALQALTDPPPIDDLLEALNLFIINFESGKYNIPPARMDFLKFAAGFIQKLPPGTVIEIGGHTDTDDTEAKNQTLSENRAKAVRDALVDFKVNPEMLTVKGYGETKLKFPQERTDLEKYKNRRIEYTAVKR